MKIKIISGKDKWYGKYIGKTYHVKKIWDDCYIIRNYKTILRTVSMKDAQIIPDTGVITSKDLNDIDNAC